MNQWTFQIKDVVDGEGAQISVYADTYDGAVIKVMNLEVPSLEDDDDLILLEVVEIMMAVKLEAHD